MNVAIVGAGWAGMAAAVETADAGHEVTVFEATRSLGGRARALDAVRPDGLALTLDNGQHILIGAYSQALALMQRVGVDLPVALLALPLGLPYPDGSGLQTPGWAVRWPAPLDALAAIATARGWSWRERLALVRASLGWQRAGFACAPSMTVAQLCARLPARVMDELIEPLCVSALNIPGAQASAQVFLNVMRDALFGQGHAGLGASHLLLPRTDLSALMPLAAARWLQARHANRTRIQLGARVLRLQRQPTGWRLHGQQDGRVFDAAFDRVIWATAAGPAAQTVAQAAADASAAGDAATAHPLAAWADTTAALRFTAISTVYAWAPGARLVAPLLALPAMPAMHDMRSSFDAYGAQHGKHGACGTPGACGPDGAPGPLAQFVFDRGQLNPHDAAAQGVLAFVVSASEGGRDALQARVLQQAAEQLGLHGLQAIQTVVDKRATFACTPGLQRPAASIAPGLWAAGDYVDGPYPATLEGAVRSGLAAAKSLH